jgi:TP901 family phage tail tape measure protein
LAGTTTQATLGLVITAKDEARQVFEEFAVNLKEQMMKIQESMTNAFNMEGAITKVNEASTQMTEALGRVRVAEEEMSNNSGATRLEEQMTQMTESVNRMSESVTRGFQNVSEQADRTSNSMHNMATGINFGEVQNTGMMMQMAGEKIVGFFGAAVKAGAEFDQSIKNATSSLNANLTTTKLSKDQIDAMSRSALNLGQSGFFSANQIAEAMNTMAKQGISYQQIMSGGIQTVYKVAAANQQDLEMTANVVSDIYNEMGDHFKKLGLTTQQAAQQIGNSMTVALHHARLSMDDFMQTMKYVGPQASAMGMGIQDVSAAIAVLGEHGIKGSQAGTTLRRMLTNLTPASKGAAKMFEQLGFIVGGQNQFFDGATGKLKSMTEIQGILHSKLGALNPEMQQFYIKALFGQYALSGMTAIIGTSTDKFTELTKEMKNNSEMDQIMATKSQGLGMQLQALNAHWQTMQKEIGLALAPLLVGLIGILNKLMDAWGHLSPSVQKTIAIIGAVTGVVLLVGGVVLTFIGTLGMFITSAGAAAGAFAAIGGAIATAMPVILAVVAIIAVLKYAWDHDIGGIREVTTRFIDWFKPVFGKTFETVKKDVMSGLASLTAGFTGWNRSVMGPINKAMAAIWEAISAGMKKLITVVSQGITAVTGWFKTMAPEFNKALHNIIAFLEWLSPLWKALWVVLKFVVGLVFDYIVGIFQHAWGVFSGIVQLFTHIINGEWGKAFGDLWQIVKNAFLLALDFMGGGVGKAVGWLAKFLEHTGLFGKAFSKILTVTFKWLEGIANGTWKMVEGIFKGSIKVLETTVTAFSKVIEVIFKAIKSFIETHASGAMTILKTVFTAGINIAKILLKGLWTEVKDILGFIKALFSGEPSKAMKYLMDAFKTGYDTVKNLTSAWFTAITNFFKVLVSSIVHDVSDICLGLKNLFKAGFDFVKSLLDPFFQKVSSIFNSVKTAISTAVGTAMTYLKTVFSTEISFVKTVISGFSSYVSSIFNAIKSLIEGHSGQAMAFLKQAFQAGINTVKSILQGLWQIADAILGGLPSKFLNWGKKAISELGDGIKGGIGFIQSAISSISSRVDAALGGLPSKMLNYGKNAMNMFVSGLKSGIGAIGSAVSGAADKIKSFLGFHSPAKEGPASRGESDQWMPNLMNMLAKGIDDNKDKVKKATMGVAVGIQSTFKGTQDHIHSVINGANASSVAPIASNNNNQRPMTVHIHVEGRSKQTDKQLSEEIAKQFRTQISMVMS